VYIKCGSIDDFIVNLRQYPTVYNKVVYADITRTGITGSGREMTSFEVFFQASAVVISQDGGEALLQFGQSCGIDRKAQPESIEGSDVAIELKRQLSEYLDHRGFVMLPGVISES
jgi:hypothetical protein